MAGQIWLRYEVPSQNVAQRWHWSRRAKDVKAATQEIAWRVKDGCIPPAIAKRRVIITSYRRTLIKDEANLIGGCKNLVDALVNAKVLKDDSSDMCVIQYQQFQIKDLKLAKERFPDLCPKFPPGMWAKPCSHVMVEEV